MRVFLQEMKKTIIGFKTSTIGLLRSAQIFWRLPMPSETMQEPLETYADM